MFDNLSEKFTKIVQNLTNKGKISEQDIKSTLREVRLALLEADVDFNVAKKFISSIEDKAKKENVFSLFSGFRSRLISFINNYI